MEAQRNGVAGLFLIRGAKLFASNNLIMTADKEKCSETAVHSFNILYTSERYIHQKPNTPKSKPNTQT